MDIPPEPPAIPSKPPAEGLVDCGLDDQGFTVSLDDTIQGYVIEISERAGANNENLQCVWDATWSEFVHFESGELQLAYEELSSSRFEPLAKQAALDYLDKHGRLQGLPKRADFSTVHDFAVAIEMHCGFAANQMLQMSSDTVMFYPKSGIADLPRNEKVACLISALAVSSEVKFGFIGNDVVGQSEDK